MKTFLIIGSLFLTGLLSAQPLKVKDELVLEASNIAITCEKECLKEVFKDTKVSASLFTRSVRPWLITTAIFKLSGEQSKIGGQSWLKFYNHGKKQQHSYWVGGELNTDSEFKIGRELFIAYEYSRKNHTGLFYSSLVLKSEVFSSFGIKYHYKKALSFGVSLHKTASGLTKGIASLDPKDWRASASLGIPVKHQIVDQLLKAVGLD